MKQQKRRRVVLTLELDTVLTVRELQSLYWVTIYTADKLVSHPRVKKPIANKSAVLQVQANLMQATRKA